MLHRVSIVATCLLCSACLWRLDDLRLDRGDANAQALDGGGGDSPTGDAPLGGDTTAPGDATPPGDTFRAAPLPRLSTGRLHTCASYQGDLVCWGANASGQIGDGTKNRATTPKVITGLPFVEQVSAGFTHSCAVAGGDFYCWGNNGDGQLGLGDNAERLVPTALGIAGTAELVAAGDGFTCGVVDGDAYCWGRDGIGQLGNGVDPASDVPVLVQGLPAAASTAMTAGQDHACVIAGTDAYCWGHDDNGALGNGPGAGSTDTAGMVLSLPGPISAIAIGGWHTCGLVNGAVYCWGTGGSGELGDGNNSSTQEPVATLILTSDVTHIDVNGNPSTEDSSCAVQFGAAYCWGNNNDGRLGDGTTDDLSIPTKVVGLESGIASVHTADHSCAVRLDGSVVCWGRNDEGQLGRGDLIPSGTPLPIVDWR